MNTSETQSIHDSMNILKIEFISKIHLYFTENKMLMTFIKQLEKRFFKHLNIGASSIE